MTKRGKKPVLAAVLAALVAGSAAAYAQDPPPAGQAAGQGRGQRAQVRGGQRAGVPPITRNMDAQQMQIHLDAVALVQAERQLKLTAEQYPNFVAKMTRLQAVRRRLVVERRRVFNELRGLLEAPSPREDTITEKLRTLEDINRRGADEVIKSYQDVDTVLSPWQRGRFRLLEEQLERQKIEILARIAAMPPASGKIPPSK